MNIYIYITRSKINNIANLVGGTQIRTGGRGFAIHCLTTWPYRRLLIKVNLFKLIYVIL